MRTAARCRLPRRLLVTDAGRRPDPLPAAAALPAGSGIVFRHYGAPGRAALAARLATLAKARRLVLLVAGDWRLADRVGAAGVHLPEGMLFSGRLAPLLGWARRKGRAVTAACHGPAALARARRLGVCAALLAPVFATASHPGAPAIGPVRFAAWTRRAGLPVIALGGVTPRTARRLNGSGAAGIAGVGAERALLRFRLPNRSAGTAPCPNFAQIGLAAAARVSL
ncbi:MAG: thiamine phosphate synthase [Magnetospirillum sp.]|nr:thiamine phosphate synthase [Magnetospirillum sp.]